MVGPNPARVEALAVRVRGGRQAVLTTRKAGGVVKVTASVARMTAFVARMTYLAARMTDFAALMTYLVARIGTIGTHFANPHAPIAIAGVFSGRSATFNSESAEGGEGAQRGVRVFRRNPSLTPASGHFFLFEFFASFAFNLSLRVWNAKFAKGAKEVWSESRVLRPDGFSPPTFLLCAPSVPSAFSELNIFSETHRAWNAASTRSLTLARSTSGAG